MAEQQYVTRREFAEVRRANRRALKLQAREYERRLKHLNGEQKRIAAAAAVTLRKDIYDAERKTLEARLNILETAENRRAGAMRLVFVLATSGAVSGVVGLASLFLPKPALPPQVVPLPYYAPAAPGTMVPQPQQTPQR